MRAPIPKLVLALAILGLCSCELLLGGSVADAGEADASELGGDAGADAGAGLSCAKSADCQSSDLCCAHLSLGSGVAPSCPVTAASSSCTATCAESFSPTCPAEQTLRLCVTSAECTGPGYPACCQLSNGGLSGKSCLPKQVADALGCQY